MNKDFHFFPLLLTYITACTSRDNSLNPCDPIAAIISQKLQIVDIGLSVSTCSCVHKSTKVSGSKTISPWRRQFDEGISMVEPPSEHFWSGDSLPFRNFR